MIHIIKKGLRGRGGVSPRFFTISTTKTVTNDVANSMCNSNIHWRGVSNAASVCSDIQKAKGGSRKGQKQVSKDERRAMVKSYVNKYKEAHAGKFPSLSSAHKQVGGSFYVVRRIFQELEHESKISSSNSGKESLLGKELIKESKYSTEVENASTGGVMLDVQNLYDPQAVGPDDGEVANASDRYLEGRGQLQTSKETLPEDVVETMAHEDYSDIVGTQRNLLEGDATDVSHPCPEKSEDGKVEQAWANHPDLIEREMDAKWLDMLENHEKEKAQGGYSQFVAAESHEDDRKEHTTSKDLINGAGPKHKEGSPEPNKYAKDISSRQTNDAELPKKSTLWGNLKSFADGIINIWRKL